MSGNAYFDREGQRIDLLAWAELQKRDEYRFVERTWVIPDRLEVVTLWEGFDPYRGGAAHAAPHLTFRVSELHWKDGKLGDVYEHSHVATEADARTNHGSIVAKLKRRLASA